MPQYQFGANAMAKSIPSIRRERVIPMFTLSSSIFAENIRRTKGDVNEAEQC